MNNLFSIGELSKHQNISRQTLIFYDKIGLFKPAYIDPNNGYRYYNISQLDYLDTICIMKKIGFSLNEIKTHMQNYNLESSVIAMRKQLSAIDRQIHSLQLIKSRVEHRCQQLEHSASYNKDIKVYIENIDKQYILLEKIDAPYGLEQTSIATKKCFVKAFKKQLPIFFQSAVIVPLKNIKKEIYTEADYAFLPIEKCKNKDILELPKGKCVITYHTGDYNSIGDSYSRVLKYCETNNIKIISDSYEFAINDYLSTKNEAEYITKIMFYIKCKNVTND